MSSSSYQPLDGGWGWFVVLGSFINQGFVIGGARSFGIIFVHLREYFGASSAAASWAAGLLTFGLSFFCPLAALLAKRYTFRKVAMIGAVAQGLAFVLAAFSTQTYFVSFIIGGISGFAAGFLQTISVSAVSQFFSKRSSLAMGIAASGVSVGQLIIPQILRNLLDNFGYFGCVLIYGAVAWNSLPASALFRPISFYSRREQCEISARLSDPEEAGAITSGARHDVLGEATNTSSSYQPPDQKENVWTTRTYPPGSDTIQEAGATNRKLDFDLTSGSTTLLDRVPESSASARHLENTTMKREETSISGVHIFFDPTFTRNPKFWIFVAAIFLGNPTVHNMFVFLPPYAKEIKLSKKQASYLLSIGGVSDFVGKLAGGAFNNLQLIRTRHFLAIVLSFLAIISSVCMSFPSYRSMVFMSVMMGLLGGAYSGINPVYLLEVIGGDKFPMAFTLAVAIHAVSSLATPTLSGVIADYSGSYRAAYWLFISMMASAAILFEMEPVTNLATDKMEQGKRSRHRDGKNHLHSGQRQSR